MEARCGDAADVARRRLVRAGGKNGGRFSTEASIAKLFASKRYVDHAPGRADPRRHGLFEGDAARALLRDAKITEIYEGTSEIQRLVIARNETGLR
jgi:alkylation response protein AidB-like acyl-CoA dehydrogenase